MAPRGCLSSRLEVLSLTRGLSAMAHHGPLSGRLRSRGAKSLSAPKLTHNAHHRDITADSEHSPGGSSMLKRVSILGSPSGPSGCVVWIGRAHRTGTHRLDMEYRWSCGAPRVPPPDLGAVVAKHSKANAQGRSLGSQLLVSSARKVRALGRRSGTFGPSLRRRPSGPA
jgi:hypothetical protein